jgi:hypothetical protein
MFVQITFVQITPSTPVPKAESTSKGSVAEAANTVRGQFVNRRLAFLLPPPEQP